MDFEVLFDSFTFMSHYVYINYSNMFVFFLATVNHKTQAVDLVVI